MTEYSSRLKKFLLALRRRRLDAALVTHLPNIRYLSGFTGFSGVLGVAGEEARLFTDGRYTTQAGKEVAGTGINVVIDRAPLLAAATWLRSSGGAGLGFEGKHLVAADWTTLRQHLRRRAGKMVDLGSLLEELRMVKDAKEIAQLRAAARLGSSLFEVALKHLRPGETEAGIAAEMEYAARRGGGEGMSFPTIVAAGARSALPHGRASIARLPRRGFVVLDFGVILSGYCSDMTRTVHLGEPSAHERKVYGAVRRAQEAAVRGVRPGVSFAAVDRLARSILDHEGLGKYFTHSCGHGVGLEIHEPPRLGAGQNGRLRPGMVITVEPGVYIPGEGGVRIEDMVLVTERGHEILTRGTRQLIVR